MTYKIVTRESRTFVAQDVVEDVSYGFNDSYIYYMFLGKHTPYANDEDDPVKPRDSEKYKRGVYNNMLFGKRVTTNDARVMVSRHDYVSNAVYDMYRDNDRSLFSKNYYVVVNRSNEHDVFKCLYNNKESPSIYPPNKLDIDNFDEIYRTADGYVWKYMYTIPYADMEKFATSSLIPVTPNTSVTASAVDGSIDVIEVTFPGSRYDNYLVGDLGKNDISVGGDQKKFNLSGNNLSSTLDDFYVGCIFKVVDGLSAGSYSRIVRYEVSGNNRVITLAEPLALDLTSEYEIMPEVRIIGDYTQTANAFARAIVNTSANTIDYVEILDRGAGYKAATAYVRSSDVVPVEANSIVTPIMSPYGGHGYNANSELGANKSCFSVTFNPTIDKLPAINDFRQVGIMTNPRFANVQVNFSSKDPVSFISGELVYQIDPVRLYASGVTLTAGANTITATTSAFDQLEANTKIYLVGSGLKQLATVTGITNSTSMTVDVGGLFSCTDCEFYLANTSGQAKVVNDIVSGVAITEVFKPYDSGSTVVGYNSGAAGVVNNMVTANNATLLNTFNQMWKYYISTSGTFEEDELIYQPTSAANSHGKLFGIEEVESDTIMYLTNPVGYINTGEDVIGANSEDTATVISSYEPDLIYNSGRIIYLENLEQVARSPSQKETFKIIFSY